MSLLMQLGDELVTITSAVNHTSPLTITVFSRV